MKTQHTHQNNYKYIVLYNVVNNYQEMLKIGKLLFNKLGIRPNEFSCYVIVPKEREDFDDGDYHISENEIEKWMGRSDLLGFRLAYQEPNARRWTTLFHYFADALHHEQKYLIIEHIDEKNSTLTPAVIDAIKSISETCEIPYGFALNVPEQNIITYKYHDAQVIYKNLFTYEDQKLWKTEVPSYLISAKSPRRYLTGMLRLVYEINIISNLHLLMRIESTDLKNWILENPTRGKLEEINNKLWTWSVSHEFLEGINKKLHDAGILISAKFLPPPQRGGLHSLNYPHN